MFATDSNTFFAVLDLFTKHYFTVLKFNSIMVDFVNAFAQVCVLFYCNSICLHLRISLGSF